MLPRYKLGTSTISASTSRLGAVLPSTGPMQRETRAEALPHGPLAPKAATSFLPSQAPFMVNYRVADLYGLLEALKTEGCNVLDKIDDSEYGKFGWVIDPEGNKVELWEPPAGQ